jgi:hypothetical protein
VRGHIPFGNRKQVVCTGETSMTATNYTSGRVARLVSEFRTTTTRVVAMRLQAQHCAKDRAEIIAKLSEYLTVAEIAGLVSEPPSEVEAMMRCAKADRERREGPAT